MSCGMLDCLLQLHCITFTQVCWLFMGGRFPKFLKEKRGGTNTAETSKPRPHLPPLFWQDLCYTAFMNNKCFLSLLRYDFVTLKAFKCHATVEISHKDITLQFLALMEASASQTVRCDAVNSLLPGIEQEINNSPTQERHESGLRVSCRYVDFLFLWKKKQSRQGFMALCYIPLTCDPSFLVHARSFFLWDHFRKDERIYYFSKRAYLSARQEAILPALYITKSSHAFKTKPYFWQIGKGYILLVCALKDC